MSIELLVLGEAGNDNAALVRIDTGQAIHRLLFDCGQDVLNSLEYNEILNIDHLFFSHLHMDHIAGFDAFFRGLYARNNKINQIWGPDQTARILQHRFCGTLWNLHTGMNATWYVHDILEDYLRTYRYELSDAFENAYLEPKKLRSKYVFEHPDYTVETIILDHRTPSLAYIVRESDRINLEPEKLKALGLQAGAWVRDLKNLELQKETLSINNKIYPIKALREELLTVSKGDAVAYCTDFILNQETAQKLIPALQGVRLLLCESQYLHTDLEMAEKNYHMTNKQVAELAALAGVQELRLFHISDRYSASEKHVLLEEARSIFANTHFPSHWE
jgi:ribonuclease Z